MMDLASNAREQIRRFVVGLVSADDLSDWLDAHAQEIHDSRDADLRRLTDLTISLLEDLFQGQRSGEDVRASIDRALPMAQYRAQGRNREA